MKRTCKATFAVVVTAGILITLAAVPSSTAQSVSKRSVDVTVTDPYGRTVAGLEKDHFAVTEGGVQRMITAFSQIREEDPKVGVHYLLEFESSAASASVQVVFNQPPGLPHLTVAWK
jgi:hypothetical protein